MKIVLGVFCISFLWFFLFGKITINDKEVHDVKNRFIGSFIGGILSVIFIATPILAIMQLFE